MSDINNVVISGMLPRDPTYRATDAGYKLCIFPLLSVNEYKKKNGEPASIKTYIDITVFGALADECAEKLAKDIKVIVSGTISSFAKVDANTNEKTYKMGINLKTIKFLSQKKVKADTQTAQPNLLQNDGMPDDDIPF